MNPFRALAAVSIVSIVAACSTSASKPAASTAPPQAAASAAVNIAGNWTLTVDSQMGPIEQKMSIVQNGKDIKGTLESPMGSVDYTGTIDRNNLKFGFNVNAQGTDLRIDYVGTVEGATMNGKAVFGSFGEGTFKGKRQ